MAGGAFDPSTVTFGRVGEAKATPNGGAYLPSRLDPNAAAVITGAHGYYCEASRNGRLFMAQAIVTAMVIYTTNTGTGGPFLWNGSTTVNANILAMGFGISTAATAAGAVGLTGGTGQTVAPTATTAIDGKTNGLLGAAPSACTAYRVGTPVTAGAWFMPIGDVTTAALTVQVAGMNWTVLDGIFTVPPNGWISPAASATLTTAVMTVGLIWEEIPI